VVVLGVAATDADGAVAAETMTDLVVIAVSGRPTGAAAGVDDGACAADDCGCGRAGDGDGAADGCGCGRAGDGAASVGDAGVRGAAAGDDGAVTVRGDGRDVSAALRNDGAPLADAGSIGGSGALSSFARAAEVADWRGGTATDCCGFCVDRPGSVAARSRKRWIFAVETATAASRPARSRRMEAMPAATPLSSASVMPIV
jgi:hypothetical protein